jgi:hypothetical protein
MTFDNLFISIDPLLIAFYRIFDNPAAGFFFGTFVVSLLCAILGEITSAAVYRINRSYYQDLAQETVRMGDMSINALRFFKDKGKYRVFNKEANDAFGKYFFSQIALGASVLWPVPFALGWMQTRFVGVSFLVPIINRSVSYMAIFILCYILIWKIKGMVYSHLQFHRRQKK